VLLLPAACGGSGSAPGEADAGPAGDAGGDAGDDAAEDGASQVTCPTGSNVFALAFDKYPQLKSVGGSVVLQVTGYTDPTCRQSFVIVAQPAAGQYVALSASCTHACCTVTFTGSEFLCPCHMSLYDLSGRVIRGPARIPLPALTACADASGVYVSFA
jgi:Rieske Fe-S protein